MMIIVVKQAYYYDLQIIYNPIREPLEAAAATTI